MAGNFTTTGQRRTVQASAGGTAQDVVEVTARTIPSGVVFTRVIPFVRWQEQGVEAALSPIAANIERLMQEFPVVNASPTQDITPAGLVSNALQFVVTTEAERGLPNPAHTALVTVPLQALYSGQGIEGYFAPVTAALEHAAAL
jgi:hypothetical protein